MLVLANAWDAGSARLVESLGAKAIATTSAGVAWSNGYPDGDRLPVPLLAGAVGGSRASSKVPLTVDVRGRLLGAIRPRSAETVAAVMDAGAVGINLEDGFGPTGRALPRRSTAIRAARPADVFVNARTDVYLRGLSVPTERRVEETLAAPRAIAPRAPTGSSCPAWRTRPRSGRSPPAARLPLNVMARPGLPPAAELQALGVRRLSAGSRISPRPCSRGRIAGLRLPAHRRVRAAVRGAMPYAEINALMPGR